MAWALGAGDRCRSAKKQNDIDIDGDGDEMRWPGGICSVVALGRDRLVRLWC